jgi:hypothetical protein
LNLQTEWRIVMPTDHWKGMIQGSVAGPSLRAWKQKERATLLLSWEKPCEPPPLPPFLSAMWSSP